MNVNIDNVQRVKVEQFLKDWIKGIPYEIAFWNNVYRWNHTFNGMMGWSNLGKVITLEGFDANAYLSSLVNPRVLDVGCGMSFHPGNYLCKESGEEFLLDIHYVDPLANFYNKISNKHKRNVPRIEMGMAEFLTGVYENDSVDLVIIQNALDHSALPIKGIIESLNVLKDGGKLYLYHNENEAECENYKGFHKWNISTDGNNNLLLWNKDEKIVVDELVSGFASVETKRVENNHIVSVLTKQTSVPDSYISQFSDRQDILSSLMYKEDEQMSFASAIKPYIIYRWFNVVQFFAQMLPYDLKMKVKGLLS